VEKFEYKNVIPKHNNVMQFILNREKQK
jgi:hypothetical protein